MTDETFESKWQRIADGVEPSRDAPTPAADPMPSAAPPIRDDLGALVEQAVQRSKLIDSEERETARRESLGGAAWDWVSRTADAVWSWKGLLGSDSDPMAPAVEAGKRAVVDLALPSTADYSESFDATKSWRAGLQGGAGAGFRGAQTWAESLRMRAPEGAVSDRLRGASESLDVLAKLYRGNAEEMEKQIRSANKLSDIRKETWFTDVVEYGINSMAKAAGSIIPMGSMALASGGLAAPLVFGAMSTGEIREAFDEAQVPWEKHEDVLYAASAVHASLENIPGLSTVRKLLTGQAQKEFEKGLVRAIARGVVKGGIREGVTEGLQTAVEVQAPIYAKTRSIAEATGAAWQDVLKGVDSKIIESAVQGAIGGAGFGGGTSAMGAAGRKKAKSEEPEAKPAEAGQPSGAAAEPIRETTEPIRDVAPMADGPGERSSARPRTRRATSPELDPIRQVIEAASGRQEAPAERASAQDASPAPEAAPAQEPRQQPAEAPRDPNEAQSLRDELGRLLGQETAWEEASRDSTIPREERQAARAALTRVRARQDAVNARLADLRAAEPRSDLEETGQSPPRAEQAQAEMTPGAPQEAPGSVPEAIASWDDGLRTALQDASGNVEATRSAEVSAMAEEARADLRQQFDRVLASKAKRSEWAGKLKATPEQMASLIDEAVADGRLRRTAAGQVVRVKGGRQAVPTQSRPEAPQAEAQATPAAPAPAPTMDRVTERRLDAVKSPVARGYAQRLVEAENAEAVPAIVDAIRADKKATQAVLDEIATVLGDRGKKVKNKGKTLERIAAAASRTIGERPAPVAVETPALTATASPAGLTPAEMAIMRRVVTQSTSTQAALPSVQSEQTLRLATNAQLRELEDAAGDAYRSAPDAQAERIQRWRDLLREIARDQVSDVVSDDIPRAALASALTADGVVMGEEEARILAQHFGAAMVGSLPADAPHPGRVVAWGRVADETDTEVDGFGFRFTTAQAAAETEGVLAPAVIDATNVLDLPVVAGDAASIARAVESARPDMAGLADRVSNAGELANDTLAGALSEAGIEAIRYHDGSQWTYLTWEPGRVLRASAPAAAISATAETVGLAKSVAIGNLRRGIPVNVAAAVRTALHDAIKADTALIPGNVSVGALKRAKPIGPMPGGDTSVELTFERQDRSEFKTTLPLSLVDGARALSIPGRLISDGQDAVVFLRTSTGKSFAETTRGELWHEVGHVLLRRNLLPGEVRGRLLGHAKALRILDTDVSSYLQMIGEADWNVGEGSLLDSYRALYRGRTNAQDAIDQEYVTHLVELYVHGELLPQEIEPVADILSDIVSGRYSGNGVTGAGSEAILVAIDSSVGQSMRRDLDSLGYYSKALEAAKGLKQAKGTPEQMLAQLKKAGVKDAEIEATGLHSVLDGKNSITRDEIVSHLEGNRVGLREVVSDLPPRTRHSRRPRWAPYSLDPSNPTYRETVLHLPEPDRDWQMQQAMAAHDRGGPDAERAFWATQPDPNLQIEPFRSGHFPEPNIVGHMMTSMTTHEGRPVFTIDQIQSDWGQKLRDGGVRDEAKIADLQKRITDMSAKWVADADLARLEAEAKALADEAYPDGILPAGQNRSVGALNLPSRRAANPWDAMQALAMDGTKPGELRERASGLRLARQSANSMYEPTLNMLRAELRTAEAATPGNPLVNTTDQWVNTTLRRAIRQAAEAGAEFIAIPSGDTVLSYNPGDENGMRGFYGSATSEGIVPKNLRKLLSAVDKATPAPARIDTLDSPSGKTGLGKGFTLFRLTDAAKTAVMEEGQPMFSAVPRGLAPAARARAPEIEQAIGEAVSIITRMTGQGAVDVRFTDAIAPVGMRPEQAAAVEMMGGDVVVPGTYRPPVLDAKAVITLALESGQDPRITAGHEAYHHVETVLATPSEMTLLQAPSEMARAKRLARAEVQDMPQEAFDSLPDWEVRAIAFQRYRRMREEGMTVAPLGAGVRRFWDGLVRMFQNVRNVLRGQGFDSMESIFERARTGEMAARAPAAVAGGVAGDAMASSAPGLDMSLEARKARAEDMGFDTSRVLYHGTDRVFTKFVATQGSYLSSGPDVASVMLTDRPSIAAGFADRSPENIQQIRGRAPAVYPVYVRGRLKEVQAYYRNAAGLTGQFSWMSRVMQKARNEGYDGVSFKNLYDRANMTGLGFGPFGSSNVVAVFDPSNIRSVNAAFDPAEDGSPQLMASILPRRKKDSDNTATLNEAIVALSNAIGMTPTQTLMGVRIAGETADGGQSSITLNPRSNVRGQTTMATGAVGVRRSRDMEAIAHEGAHYLETTIGAPVLDFQTQFATELQAFADPSKPFNKSEAFAEFFRRYVMGADAVRASNESMVDSFEDLIETTDPDMLDGLHQAQTLYKQWMDRSTPEQLASDVVSTYTSNSWADLRSDRAFQNIPGKLATAYTNTVDDLNPLNKMVRKLLEVADRNGVRDPSDPNRPISLAVHDNPYKRLRMFRGSYATGYSWLKNGVRLDSEVAPSTPSLAQALETLFGTDNARQWDPAMFKTAGQYLISKRAIAEYERLEAKEERLGEIDDLLTQGGEAWRRLSLDEQSNRQTLETRQTALVRAQTRLSDTRRALGVAEREATRLQERIQDKRDDILAAQMAREPSLANRRRSELTILERQSQQSVREVERLIEEFDGHETDVAMLSAEIDQREAIAGSIGGQLRGLQDAIGRLRREREATEKRGASRPPTKEPKEWHQEFMGKVEGDPRYARIKEFDQQVHEFAHGLLRLQFEAGFIDQEQFDALAARKDWYVPFQRDMSDADAGAVFFKGNSSAWSPFKKFDGSDRAIINPLETLAEDAYALAAKISRNKATDALARLADRAGPGSASIAQVLTREESMEANAATYDRIREIAVGMGIDESDARRIAQRIEDDFSDEQMLKAVWSPATKGPVNLPTLPLWRNGERVMVRLTDPEFGTDVFNAVSGLGREQMHWFLEGMAVPARILQMGVTTHPTFMPRNLFRDMKDAWIKTGALPIVTQVRGARLLRDKDFMRQYMEAGGITGGRNVAALTMKEQQVKLIGDKGITAAFRDNPGLGESTLSPAAIAIGAIGGGLLGAVYGGPIGGLAGAVAGGFITRKGNVLKAVEAVETMTRLGVAAHAYKRAKAHNPDLTDTEAMLEAAFVARDVFDWNRRGSKTLALTRTITFLNAQIQGLDKSVRSLSGESDRGATLAKHLAIVLRRESGDVLSRDEQRAAGDAYKTFGRVAILTAFYVSLYLLATSSDDEDKDLKYEDIRDKTKATHSWLTQVDILGTKVDVRLPKAFEWAVPANTIEIAIDKMKGRDPRAWDRLVDSAFEVLVPPGVPQFAQLAAGLVANVNLEEVAPSAIKRMLGHSPENKQTRQVVGDNLLRLDPEAQFDAFSSQLSIDIAKAMAKVVDRDLVPSPKKIDFILRSGGYWGQDIGRGYGVIKESLGGRPREAARVSDFPVLAGFTGVAARQSKSRDELFQLMAQSGGQLTTAANTYKNYLDNEGTPGEAARFLANLEPDERAYALLKYYGQSSDVKGHPLERLMQVDNVVGRIRKDMILDRLTPVRKEGRKTRRDWDEKIALPPRKQTEVHEILERLQQAEAWNSMVLMRRPGWEGKREFAVKPILDELKASSPQVFELYEDRVSAAKVQEFDDVKSSWPARRTEILRDGVNAF